MFIRRPASLAAGTALALLVALLMPSVCLALGGCRSVSQKGAEASSIAHCERAHGQTEPQSPGQPTPEPPAHQWSCCDERAVLAVLAVPVSPREPAMANVPAVLPSLVVGMARRSLAATGADPPPLRVPLYTLHAALLI